jgi:hypothetical protein
MRERTLQATVFDIGGCCVCFVACLAVTVAIFGLSMAAISRVCFVGYGTFSSFSNNSRANVHFDSFSVKFGCQSDTIRCAGLPDSAYPNVIVSSHDRRPLDVVPFVSEQLASVLAVSGGSRCDGSGGGADGGFGMGSGVVSDAFSIFTTTGADLVGTRSEAYRFTLKVHTLLFAPLITLAFLIRLGGTGGVVICSNWTSHVICTPLSSRVPQYFWR